MNWKVVGPVTCYVATCGKYCTLTILPTPLKLSYLLVNYMVATMYLYVLLYMSDITLLPQQYSVTA